METIPLDLIVWIAAFVMIMGTLYWVFKPNKCPICGETMLDEYEPEEGIVSRSCPKCGYIEKK